MELKCPACQSDAIRHSRQRRLEKIFSCEPYRCRECRRRFLVFRKKPLQSLAFWLVAGGLLVSLLFVFQVISHMGRGKLFAPPLLHDQDRTIETSVGPEEHDGIEQAGEAQDLSDPVVQTSVPEDNLLPLIKNDKQEIAGKEVPENTDDGEGLAILTPESLKKRVPLPPPIVEQQEPLVSPAVTRLALQVLTASQVLKSITSEKTTNGVRVILVSDKSIDKYTFFRLDSPKRLVIDLPGVWDKPKELEVQTGDSGLIKRIRIGRHSDKLRAVIYLTEQEIAPPIIRGVFGEIVIDLLEEPAGLDLR